MIEKLVRWRADPKKIRVSIRKSKDFWTASVKSLINNDFVCASNVIPEEAVMTALQYAEDQGLKGVDLDMAWAYTHPWK